jgi:hypothetical protein
MALVSRSAPDDIEVPHEPGNYFSLRPLTALQMDEVRAKGMASAMEKIAMAAAAQQALSTFSSQEIEEAEEANATERQENPAMGKDPTLLVRYGVVGWRGPKYDGAECDGAAKDDLDEPTRDWAAGEVAKLSAVTMGEANGSALPSANGGAPADAEPISMTPFAESGSPS